MKEINNLEQMGVGVKSRVLVFMPHPDDEAVFISGLLQKLVTAKITFRVVAMTKGESPTSYYISSI